MNQKKDIERNILNLVYSQIHNLNIEHQDKPDFWVKSETQKIFGVEVTQLFESKSSARLRNIPNYIEQLPDKGSYKHRDDAGNLKIDKIKIVQGNGDHIEAEAIIQVLPSLQDYLKFIEDRIDNKNENVNLENGTPV